MFVFFFVFWIFFLIFRVWLGSVLLCVFSRKRFKLLILLIVCKVFVEICMENDWLSVLFLSVMLYKLGKKWCFVLLFVWLILWLVKGCLFVSLYKWDIIWNFYIDGWMFILVREIFVFNRLYMVSECWKWVCKCLCCVG